MTNNFFLMIGMELDLLWEKSAFSFNQPCPKKYQC